MKNFLFALFAYFLVFAFSAKVESQERLQTVPEEKMEKDQIKAVSEKNEEEEKLSERYFNSAIWRTFRILGPKSKGKILPPSKRPNNKEIKESPKQPPKQPPIPKSPKS